MLSREATAGDGERLFAESAVALEHVTLTRRTQEELHYDLKRTLLRLVSGRLGKVRRRTVLSDVSVRIRRGEKVGIIGPNGSGKTTLLKVIAGILQPSQGRVTVHGAIAPLIELGAGFDPELSVMDNIVYYGVLLGHDEREISARVESILEFSELGDHREEPTKTLSSGMAARLSFAIATEFRPDILLVDEVLSVGDERFRRKCDARINRFWDENSTIVLVSHDMLTIAEHCNRVIWLEQGRVRFDGAAEDAARMYLESIPSVSTFRRGDDLLAHAEAHPRREVLVRAASGGQQLYLVRGGVRHLVGSPAWCERNGYSGEHLLIIDDEVIAQIPEGEVLS